MRRPSPSRRLLAALVAPALVLALAACGSDKAADSSGTPAPSSGGASESTGAAGDGSGPTAGEEVDPAEFIAMMKASMDDATTAHLDLTMTGAGSDITAEGVVDYQTTPPSMAMTMNMPTLGSSPIDMRLLDGVMYMNLGEMSAGKFFAIDLSDKNSPFGDMSGLVDSMNPLRSFDEFDVALKSVTFVGDEDVDGESMAHYTMRVDTSKMKSLNGQSAGVLPKMLDYDLWFDGDNHLRQMQMDMGSAGNVKTRMFDWGKPVEIAAPPASEITEMPGMQGAA